MSNTSFLSKLIAGRSPILLFLLACSFPISATILDLIRSGLPFSLDSVFAAQTTQPLHWIIDAVPFLILLGAGFGKETFQSTTFARTHTQGPQSTTTTKLTQSLSELKSELAKQKRVEETLRVSEEFYRNLVENANDGIGTISLDGTITSVNRGLELMLGKDRQEIIGRHYSTLLSISSLALIEDRLRRFQSGEKLPSLFEMELLHSNGTSILVEARTRPITDKDGAPVGFQGIYRDVTKRSALTNPGFVTPSAQSRVEIGLDNRNSSPLSFSTQSAGTATNKGAQFTGYSPEYTVQTTSLAFSPTSDLSSAPYSPQNYSSPSPSAVEQSALHGPAFSSALNQDMSPTTPSEFRISKPPNSSGAVPHFTHMRGHPETQKISSQFSFVSESPSTLDRPTRVVPFPSFNSPGETASFSPAPPPSFPQQIFNLDEALNRVDGDRELLREMAVVFLDEYPRLVGTMRDALSHGNAQTLTYAVHTLKGSVGNFAANSAYDAVIKLERIGRQGNLEQAKSALAEVEAELSHLAARLTMLKMEAAA